MNDEDLRRTVEAIAHELADVCDDLLALTFAGKVSDPQFEALVSKQTHLLDSLRRLAGGMVLQRPTTVAAEPAWAMEDETTF